MLNEIDNGSILSLGLDSTGPGLFDAFFASLSMIIVSEVSLTKLLCTYIRCLILLTIFIATVL